MRYIEISDLTFYYDDEPVLEDVSYHVDAGEFVILTGENGAAKSTLVKSRGKKIKYRLYSPTSCIFQCRFSKYGDRISPIRKIPKRPLVQASL